MDREQGCLDDESIVRFHAGRLDAEARSAIERHVDACAACALLVVPTGSRPGMRRLRDAHALAPGDLVAGRYRIERLVGGGGMGEVYAALDEQLGERVALKTVRAAIADDAGAITRLKSEVQLARRVTHPNVCRIYDLGTESAASGRGGKLAFLTMELLVGRTLAEAIRHRGAFPDETAGKVTRHLVAGLTAAHRAGVIHKDFKSENVILVTPAGAAEGSDVFARAVITDFGLAAPEKLSVSCTDENRIEFSGTPGYIAPERLRGGLATPASDVYSLGIVLLDMLDGRVPARPRPPTAAPAVTLDLRSFALRCCADRPEERPPLDALAVMLSELGQRPPRRPRRVARFAGAAALLATAIGGLASWSRPAPRARPAPFAAPPFVAEAPPPVAAAPAAGALPASPLARPPRSDAASRHPSGVARGSARETHAAPPVADSTEPSAPAVESAPRADEPIRSLDVGPRRRGAVTLGAEDDAPIDPFAERR